MARPCYRIHIRVDKVEETMTSQRYDTIRDVARATGLSEAIVKLVLDRLDIVGYHVTLPDPNRGIGESCE